MMGFGDAVASAGVQLMPLHPQLLDHTQTICTLLQTDNHTNPSSLHFYRPDALPDAQPTVSKQIKAQPFKYNLNSVKVNQNAKSSSSSPWSTTKDNPALGQ